MGASSALAPPFCWNGTFKLLLLLLLLLLLNTLQAQGEHENGGKVLWVKSDVLDGHTLTLQCSQRDAKKIP